MKKYKKGFTAGTFDMFHIGHLNLINNAKKKCETLIVGVNSDELVKKYKNKIPIINQNERFEIIKALKNVDEVCLTLNLDKLEMWEKYKFDVVFIGDDWKNSTRWIETEKELSKKGIDVIYLPYTKGISSTALREKIETKISIIMPVYNSELFVEKTIESIRRQSFKEWELIIVDDQSSDTSYEKCQNFSNLDSRIKVYRNSRNLGISKTRNQGMLRAKGKYIVFCDDDDLMTPNLLSENYKIMEELNVDLIKFGRILIEVDQNGKNKILKKNKTIFKRQYRKKEMLENYFEIRENDRFLNVWNGMYKKEIIEKFNIRFDETMKFGSEDANFSFKYFLAANSIYVTNTNYYIHFKRKNKSTSLKYNYNKIESILKTLNVEKIIFDKLPIRNEVEIIKIKISYYNNIIVNQLFNIDSNLTKEKRIEIYNFLNKQNELKFNPLSTNVFKLKIKYMILYYILRTKNYNLIDNFYKIGINIKRKLLKWY